MKSYFYLKYSDHSDSESLYNIRYKYTKNSCKICLTLSDYTSELGYVSSLQACFHNEMGSPLSFQNPQCRWWQHNIDDILFLWSVINHVWPPHPFLVEKSSSCHGLLGAWVHPPAGPHIHQAGWVPIPAHFSRNLDRKIEGIQVSF